MEKINEWMVKVEDYLACKENRLMMIDFIEKFMVIGGILVTLILMAATLLKE